MAMKSTFKNMVVCLTVICLVCSVLLGGVYAITKAPIEKAAAEKLRGAIAEVLPEFSSMSESLSIEYDGQSYSYYEVSDSTGAVLGYAVTSASTGFGGPVSLMVGVLPDGVVYNTKVLSHSETPGLGAKCTEPAFADQFKMLNPAEKKLEVKKNGGDIDAITAATITSNAYTKAVALAVKVAGAIAASGEALPDEPSQNNGGNSNE